MSSKREIYNLVASDALTAEDHSSSASFSYDEYKDEFWADDCILDDWSYCSSNSLARLSSKSSSSLLLLLFCSACVWLMWWPDEMLEMWSYYGSSSVVYDKEVDSLVARSHDMKRSSLDNADPLYGCESNCYS